MHAGARLHDVDHDQTDQQGNGGDDFEVQQRIAAGLADRFHVLHAGDAADNGTEDDRCDDHFDQFDEPVTQRLEGYTGLRVEVTEQDADSDGNDHLEVQGFIQWLTSRHCKVPQECLSNNIRLLSLTPQLRTLLHWRDLFCRAARWQTSAACIASPVPPSKKTLPAL